MGAYGLLCSLQEASPCGCVLLLALWLRQVGGVIPRNKSPPPPFFEMKDNKVSERCTAYDDADIFGNDLRMMQRAGADEGDWGDGAEWY